MKRPLYQAIASALQARANCEKSGNWEWFELHDERIETLCKYHMPSGSGFDAGTQLDLDRSTPEKLVFKSAYHHMNDVGYYDGWSELTVTVKPSLCFGIDLKITGIMRKYRHDEDAFYDLFDAALRNEVE